MKRETPHVVSYKFPENFDDVLALPGIGRYTAGAICSIAFNQPTPILDGNVIRVLTRIFGIAENPKEKETNARLWKLAAKLVATAVKHRNPRSSRREEAHSEIGNRQSLLTSAATITGNCSALNQSLMELGALVCTPRNPQCVICPVQKLCVAFRENRVDELPNLGKRAAATSPSLCGLCRQAKRALSGPSTACRSCKRTSVGVSQCRNAQWRYQSEISSQRCSGDHTFGHSTALYHKTFHHTLSDHVGRFSRKSEDDS